MLRGEGMSPQQTEVGTVGYAAPEMLAGTATGPEGDDAWLRFEM